MGMSYIETNLIKGEKILHKGKTSLWSFSPRIALGVLLLFSFGELNIIGPLIGLFFLASVATAYYTNEIGITNRRVIAKFGLIRRSTIEIHIPKIESIQVDQGILGRIFDYGSIVVSGAGAPKAPVPGISAPLIFRKSFYEIQESLEQKEPVKVTTSKASELEPA